MQQLWFSVKRYLKHTDLLLLGLAIAVSLFGIVLIYSATYTYESNSNVTVQLLGIAIGVLCFIVTSVIDVDRFAALWPLVFVLNVLFQLSLFVFGEGMEQTGNNSWIRFHGIGIQPGEVGKILFIFTFARHIYVRRDHLNSYRSVIELLAHGLLITAVVYLSSDDMGVAIPYLLLMLIMLACSGMSFWWVGGISACGLVALPIMCKYVMADYQRFRISVVFSPETMTPAQVEKYGYHAKHSQIALRNGGVFGQGLLNGAQTQSHILPAAHTDFIFSVCGEELGFIGCAALIFLLTAIVLRLFYDSSRVNNRFGYLMCIGIGSMIMTQVFINIGMCIGILPVIGLTLPFVSYGGTSVMTMFASIGFVAGFVARQKPDRLRYGDRE